MIHYLPIENLEERYTIMMNTILNVLVDYVYYPTQSKNEGIVKGEFLDIEGTIKFKSEQLALVSQAFSDGKVKDGDVFLVADIFFPGIESIKYMAELQDIKVEIVGYNHAGRADENDFVRKLGEWADSAEQTYLMVADRICVGSEYHKKLVMDYFNIPSEKIFVTGCVWDNDYAYGLYPHREPKMDWVIYPHRICNEKGFNEFIEIATKTPETQYLITSSNKNRKDITLPKNVLYQHGLTKQEYYKALSKSKYYLSTAHQETFGYTLREALLYGCIPIVPNRAAYKESVPKENRYETILEAINLLQTAQPLSNDYVEMFNKNAKTIIEVCTGKATGMEKK